MDNAVSAKKLLVLNLSLTLPTLLRQELEDVGEEFCVRDSDIAEIVAATEKNHPIMTSTVNRVSFFSRFFSHGDDFPDCEKDKDKEKEQKEQEETMPIQTESKLVKKLLSTIMAPRVEAVIEKFSLAFGRAVNRINSSSDLSMLSFDLENVKANVERMGRKDLRRRIGSFYAASVLAEEENLSAFTGLLKLTTQETHEDTDPAECSTFFQEELTSSPKTEAGTPEDIVKKPQSKLMTAISEALRDHWPIGKKNSISSSIRDWIYGGKSINAPSDSRTKSQEESSAERAIRIEKTVASLSSRDGELWGVVKDILDLKGEEVDYSDDDDDDIFDCPSDHHLANALNPSTIFVRNVLAGFQQCVSSACESMCDQIEEELLQLSTSCNSCSFSSSSSLGSVSQPPKTIQKQYVSSQRLKCSQRTLLMKEERRMRGRFRRELRLEK